jgi:chemotaxis protein MotA
VVGLVICLITAGAGGDMMFFVNPHALLLVFGGAIGCTFVGFPLRSILSASKVFKRAFFYKTRDPAGVIRDMVSYAEVARRDGILSLETMAKDIDDEFVVKGIRMAVDGVDPEVIQHVLNDELESLAARHESGKSIFDSIAKYAPAFGMIGTLFGLADMFRNMDDPSKIGPGMAVAMLATLWGCILSNVLASPVAEKLARRSTEEQLIKQIVVKGVMCIQSGDNPRIVEQKLKTFLSPKARKAMESVKT